MKTIEVSGVSYHVKPMPAMSVLMLAAWGVRVFGAPTMQALATSHGLPSFISAVTKDEELRKKFLALDTEEKTSWSDLAEAMTTHLGTLLEIVGDAMKFAGARLTPREIEEGVRLTCFNLLKVPDKHGENHKLVDDEGTFNLVMAPHLEQHGPLHVLSVFWAVLQAHTGFTIGGDDGKTPSR